MRKKRGIFLTFILLFFVISIDLYPETLKITLQEAIGLGLQNSSTLKAKMLAVYSAKAAVQSAKSSYYPSLGAGATLTHLFDQPKTPEITFNSITIPGAYAAASDPVSLSADLSQTIYTFGKVKNAVKIAEENVKLKELELEEEKRKLIIAIERAFFGYILAKEVFKVHEETLAHKEEALDVANRRYDAGLTPSHEVLSVETDLESFKSTVISAQNQVKFALIAVKDLLGIKEEGEFDVELLGTLEVEYYSFEKDKLIKEALSRKYEILSYRSNINIMEIQKAIIESENKPLIAGFANYTLTSGFDSETGKNRYWGEDSWDGNLTLGFSIQMPLSALFPWSKENADRQKSDLDLEQLKIGLSSIESGIRLSIENILLKLEEEKAKISSGSKSVELSQRLFKLSDTRYLNGFISSMELKDTQIGLNNVRLQYLNSIFGYKMALLDLMDLVGIDHF